MIEHIENPELLNIIQGICPRHMVYTNRPSHALVFKLNGESTYAFADRTITLSQGGVLFIPRGASYVTNQLTPGVSRYICVNFHASPPDPQPQLFRMQDGADFTRLYSQLCRCRVLDTAADRYRALSLFYEVLSLICEKDRAAYKSAATLEKLGPAVEYLRENLFDPGLEIGTLHTLCGVSDTYFRKLFIVRFGVSPKKYVLNKRLEQARAILENGESGSVREAALSAGFDDALYFSRVFKRRYGYPPSEVSR